MKWRWSSRRPGPRPNLQKRDTSAPARKHRGGRIRRAIRAVLFSGAALLGGWTAAQVYSAVGHRATTWLELREVTVTGLRIVEKEDVMNRLQLGKHVTLMELSPTQLQERLEAHPWIKVASVTRLPLHRLAVHITERRPAAVLKHDVAPLLLDEDGHVLRELRDQADPGLPFVTGIDPSRLQRGDTQSRQAARQGIQLAGLLAQTLDGRPEVDMRDQDHAVAYLKGLRFQFAGAPYDEQWDRYQAVEPIRRIGGAMQQDIDLRYSGKVIMRERATDVLVQERG